MQDKQTKLDTPWLKVLVVVTFGECEWKRNMFEANKIKQPFLQISKCPSLSQKEGGYRRRGYETNPRIQIKTNLRIQIKTNRRIQFINFQLSQPHVRGTEKGKECLANCDIHSPLVYYIIYTTHFGQNRPITLLRKWQELPWTGPSLAACGFGTICGICAIICLKFSCQFV